MKTRKDKIEQVTRQAIRVSDDVEEITRAWERLIRGLNDLTDPEVRGPRFDDLLHVLWVAASNDQT